MISVRSASASIGTDSGGMCVSRRLQATTCNQRAIHEGKIKATQNTCYVGPRQNTSIFWMAATRRD